MSENSDDTEVIREKARSKASLGDHERPRLDQSLYTAPDKPPDTIGTDPEDGLPRPFAATSIKDAEAPPMTPETFVCMADTSLFVVRNRWGDIVGQFLAPFVNRASDGRYRVPLKVALDHRVPFLDVLRHRVGTWVIVEPIRPQCKKYHRQLRPWQTDDSVQHCIRYCAALHDEHGELVSLNDETLLACEFRDPQAPDTVKQIDDFDERVVLSSGESLEDEFDVDAELAGGIFSQEG